MWIINLWKNLLRVVVASLSSRPGSCLEVLPQTVHEAGAFPQVWLCVRSLWESFCRELALTGLLEALKRAG